MNIVVSKTSFCGIIYLD